MSQANTMGTAVLSGRFTAEVSDSKTRPANTTAYAAGDVINESESSGSGLTFLPCARVEGGGGRIVRVEVDTSANASTALEAELWLFSEEPAADNDNAPFTPTDAEMLNRVGVVSLATVFVGSADAGAAGNAFLTSGQVQVPFQCSSSSKTLYGVLVARNAYTPVSGEVFTVRISIEQD